MKQEYLMVAATLHDIVRRYQEADFGSKKDVRLSFEQFPDKVWYQRHAYFLITSSCTLLTMASYLYLRNC